MGESFPESQGIPEGVSQGFQQGEPVGDTGNINPAWSELLEVVPEELHSQVTPHLQKWDQNVNTRFEKVHSKFSDYEPFVESGVSPDEINFGLGLANAIANNPEEVLQALQEHMQIEQQQNQSLAGGQGQQNESPPADPRIDQLEQVIKVLAQDTIQNRETREQQEADQAWEQELTAAREQHGEFDEDYVTYLMLQNEEMELPEAIQAYHEFVNNVKTQSRRPGPNVLGQGGAVPSRQINVKELDDQSTRKLAADMLSEYLDGR